MEHARVVLQRDRTGETYKKVVKLTFAKGALLADPGRVFNASLEGKVRLAIDLPEGGPLDEAALVALIRAAVAMNRSSAAGKREGAAWLSLNLTRHGAQVGDGLGRCNKPFLQRTVAFCRRPRSRAESAIGPNPQRQTGGCLTKNRDQPLQPCTA